jgi:RHS repeat-associated protein
LLSYYAYDALGRRYDEYYPNISIGGSPLNLHIYFSPQGQVLEERVGNTASTATPQFQYVWSLADSSAMVLRDNLNSSNFPGPARLYVQQDANDNVTAVVDGSNGTVKERYQYDPYGNVTILNATTWVGTGGGSGVAWRYLFQGGRYDYGTGWYGFQNRDYITNESGKWAERDPLGFAAGDNNFYEFVGGSPAGNTDPTGLAAGDWLDVNHGGGAYGHPGWSGTLIGWAGNLASFVPPADNIGDVGQVLSGRDFNGNPLTGWDYALTFAGAAIPIVPAVALRKAGRAVPKLFGRAAPKAVGAVPVSKFDDAARAIPLSKVDGAPGLVDDAARACENPPRGPVAPKTKIGDFLTGDDVAEAGKHAKEVGKTSGVVDRAGAKARRAERMKGREKVPGKDLDEYPPAAIKPDDPSKVSVKPIDRSQNRRSGARLRNELPPDGTPVEIDP